MPAVIHYERRRTEPDNYGGRIFVGSVPFCATRPSYDDVRFNRSKLTRVKDRVTCRRCRAKLGLSETAPVLPPKSRARKTSWERLGAIGGEDESTTPKPPMPRKPAPPVAPPPSVANDELVRHRITRVFFYLMRSHLGVDEVIGIANRARVPGVNITDFKDLMARAEQLAQTIIGP